VSFSTILKYAAKCDVDAWQRKSTHEEAAMMMLIGLICFVSGVVSSAVAILLVQWLYRHMSVLWLP
jgi:hypothetical protein